jgi:hypothetical protein
VAYAERGSPGEEEAGTGKGRLAEFTVNGVLINTWDGGNYLNAPWGIAAAPSDGFGPNSGKLLVSNFGDGTVAVFDKAKHTRSRDGRDLWPSDLGRQVVRRC